MATSKNKQLEALKIPDSLCRLWTKQDCTNVYVTSLLWTSSDNHEEHNLPSIIDDIKQLGYEPGHIIARYLFTALDSNRRDYHKAWIQIKKKGSV